MNSFKLALRICALILLVAVLGAAAYWSRLGSSRAEAGLSRVSSSLDDLSNRLEELESRMGALEKVAKAVASSRAETERRAFSPEGAQASPGAAAGGDGPSLANLSEDQSQELRDLIVDVVRKERSERKTRESEQAAALQLEMQELSKGPYGEHNYKVNSLGKKLSFTDFQKQRYYEQLMAHRQRTRELRKGVNFADPEAAKAYRDRRREADEDLETTLVTMLTPQQKDAYDALPPFEKGPGADAVIFTSTDDGLNVDFRGDLMSTVLEGAEAALPVPLGLPLDGEAAGVMVERRIEVVPGGGGAAVDVKPGAGDQPAVRKR